MRSPVNSPVGCDLSISALLLPLLLARPLLLLRVCAARKVAFVDVSQCCLTLARRPALNVRRTFANVGQLAYERSCASPQPLDTKTEHIALRASKQASTQASRRARSPCPWLGSAHNSTRFGGQLQQRHFGQLLRVTPLAGPTRRRCISADRRSAPLCVFAILANDHGRRQLSRRARVQGH